MSVNFDKYDECYAVPGEPGIIDAIDRNTGLTTVYGETEAQIRERYPQAVRMKWDDWKGAAGARQNTPIRWESTTEQQYRRMLEVLPPALWIGGGFLVGEAVDHCVMTGTPRFTAYLKRGDEFVVSSRPVTRAEFRSCVRVLSAY